MQYVQTPCSYHGDQPSVFLAGGIDDALGWRHQVTAMLCDTAWAVVNPQRHHYHALTLSQKRDQMQWEDDHRRRANLMAFWFPGKTLCPMTLFELGGALDRQQPVVVGAHPAYGHRFALDVQLDLHRPNLEVAENLETLAEEIANAFPEDTNAAREPVGIHK